MLGTILKPPARFKAVRTVLKPSGPFQSRPDGFEAVGAIIYGFKAVWPAGFATGHAQYTCVYTRTVAPSNFEAAYVGTTEALSHTQSPDNSNLNPEPS